MIIVRVGFATDNKIINLEESTRYRPAGLRLTQRKNGASTNHLQSGVDIPNCERKSSIIEVMHYVDNADVAHVRQKDRPNATFDFTRRRDDTVG